VKPSPLDNKPRLPHNLMKYHILTKDLSNKTIDSNSKTKLLLKSRIIPDFPGID